MRQGSAGRIRERWSLACALLLHAAVLLGLHIALVADPGDSESPRGAPPKSNLDEIDIAGLEAASDAPKSPVVEPEEQLAPSRVAARREPARTRSEHEREPLGAFVVPSGSESTSAGDGSKTVEAEALRAPRPRIDLGIQGEAWTRWVNSSDRSRTEDSVGAGRGRPLFELPEASSTGGLQEGLEKRDRILGLSPSGRVVTAFHEAAHDAVAPRVGRARFHVTVLRTGGVEISLGDSTDDVEGGRGFADRAARALRRKMPRIAAARKGMRVTIEVIAEESFPNGVKPGDLHGPRVDVKPPEFKSVDTVKKELERENQPVDKGAPPQFELPVRFEPPGVYLTGKGKVCSYAVGITPFGLGASGGCDPANAGAKPQRLVRARVQEEAMF
jgi:hypothetical protein